MRRSSPRAYWRAPSTLARHRGTPCSPVGHAPAPERARGLDRLMDELNAELRLGPVQRDSVRAILQRHRTRMTAVWETVRPRFDSMRAQMDSDVARQLTPEQQAKYRDHVTRYRHQKEQEKADTGSGGQKK